MRIVGIAASIFGLKCLEELRNLKCCELVGVVTAPQKFSISYRPSGVSNVLHADVTSFCQSHRIPYFVMTNGMNDVSLLNTVTQWAPDIFIVVGWYHLVPNSWREIAPAYGLHASLLPKYSGGAPLVWAIMNGEKITGITFFRFDSGVDSGPIVGQKSVVIEHSDDISTLYSKIELLGLELINEVVPNLASGNALHIIQDESLRTLFPQRSPENGLINFEQPVDSIYNFIRAQTKPYPGAFFKKGQFLIKVWSVNPNKLSLENIGPGPYWDSHGELYIVGLYCEALKVESTSIEQDAKEL